MIRNQLLICAGAACISSGEESVKSVLIDELKEAKIDAEVQIIETGCMGSCDLGPLVVVYPEGIFYQKVKPQNAHLIVREHLVKGRIVEELLYKEPTKELKALTQKEMAFFQKQVKRVLKNVGYIDPNKIEEYIARDGYFALFKAIKEMTPDEIIQVISDSMLRGRGGAGFPAGRKWRATRDSQGSQKYVVCNADEGDPGAFMDRSVLEGDPHSVIEAMTIAGYAVGANKGYMYIRAEYPLAIERTETALKQAREYGFLGKNIFTSGFDFDIEIRIGAGAFVCGEETALLRSIEGQRGIPSVKPPFPAQSGLYGKPTLINNVETYANIPLIILNGADWFKSVGTKDSPGTKVFALAGKINNTGLVEVPMGTTLRELVFEIGGGIPGGKKFKGAQTGGPSGGVITADYLDTPIDFDSVKSLGTIMGSGGLIVMDEDTCMVDIAKFYLGFCVDESCGKCTPCREGNRQLYNLMEKITSGRGEVKDLDTLSKLGSAVKATSLCGLGQSSPNPVLSTLRFFKEEYLEHIEDKHCDATVCNDLFDAPCQNTCPTDQNAWGYVTLISEGKFAEAIAVIKEANPFPGVTGRVCPHTCETKCRRGQVDSPVAICSLKRFASDFDINSSYAYKPKILPKNGRKVGIIGAGPAGLAASYYLTRKGYSVTVFEALPVAGGMMAVGIPEYRLPRDILNYEIKTIENLGVQIKLNTQVGKDISFDEIYSKYDAVLIATGAHKEQKLGIEGEGAQGSFDGITFLRNVALKLPVSIGKRVAVIGGGNSAIDSARTALRLGASDVYIVYRREKKDMPAIFEEIEEAEKEGIHIETLLAPKRVVVKNGKVAGLECVRMRLGKFDNSGRRMPEEVEGSNIILDVDTVIAAIGQSSDTSFIEEDIKLTKRGTFEVSRRFLETSKKGVFAAGDNVRGPSTVVEALGDGKRAAASIDKFLGGDGIIEDAFKEELLEFRVSYSEKEYEEPRDRMKPHELPQDVRTNNFNEVVSCFTKEQAVEEAKRCLHCYIKEEVEEEV